MCNVSIYILVNDIFSGIPSIVRAQACALYVCMNTSPKICKDYRGSITAKYISFASIDPTGKFSNHNTNIQFCISSSDKVTIWLSLFLYLRHLHCLPKLKLESTKG